MTALAFFFLLDTGECPKDTWVNGIRPDGAYECRSQMLGPDDNREKYPGMVLAGQLSCPPNRIPMVMSWRRVSCVRPPPSYWRGS